MKTKFITSMLATTFFLGSCSDKKPTEKEGSEKEATQQATSEEAAPMDSAAMMKAWMDYATPSDMHTWLASFDGTWEGELTHWMSPDAPPVKSSQIAEYKMILGGRYQYSTYKGEWDGQEFLGESTMGYDNARKVFQSTWVDNAGTGIMLMEGPMDENTKTITLEGDMTDPMTGKMLKMKQVLKFPDENTQTMEMYCEKDGKEEKNMAVVLKRK